jgi:hypothetical protein
MTALARAFVNTPPNKPGILNTRKPVGENKFALNCEQYLASIKQAFCEYPNYGAVV